jgi:hypothetical protein
MTQTFRPISRPVATLHRRMCPWLRRMWPCLPPGPRSSSLTATPSGLNLSPPPPPSVTPPSPAKSYTNFRKADGAVYVRESEAKFSSLSKPSTVGAGKKVFHETLLKASKHAIPAGYRCDYAPGISREASALIRERDAMRVVDPTDPGIDDLNHTISNIIAENKRCLWQDKVLSAGSCPN